ncbi:hypothetical protein OZ411_15305 [Bradyrhizobium sp. Arg237L]|uniref:hypothetical protein n=1 Tax=Bradyrhizobium sp. Arg237L TaxID=3003352 RepID=UPI00249EC7B7|nr:hypothetical protein [Bradyrhizobium sp. Arg237L]MDI4234177.1 hypothetical protein [Bradyrhizobium sp. Arg237L]
MDQDAIYYAARLLVEAGSKQRRLDRLSIDSASASQFDAIAIQNEIVGSPVIG